MQDYLGQQLFSQNWKNIHRKRQVVLKSKVPVLSQTLIASKYVRATRSKASSHSKERAKWMEAPDAFVWASPSDLLDQVTRHIISTFCRERVYGPELEKSATNRARPMSFLGGVLRC